MITNVMSISAETLHTLTEWGSVPALELDGPGCVSSAKSLPLSEPLLLPLWNGPLPLGINMRINEMTQLQCWVEWLTQHPEVRDEASWGQGPCLRFPFPALARSWRGAAASARRCHKPRRWAELRSQGWTTSFLSALLAPLPFLHALLSLMECPAVLRGLASPLTPPWDLNQQSKTFKAIAGGLP